MSNSFVTLSSASFLNGLGVNTHIPYTDGAYSNIPQIISDLQYLGIDNVRDGISDGTSGSAPLSSYISLAESGDKFTFLIGNWVQNNSDIEGVLGDIAQVEAAAPGSVIAIEGVNEINNEPVTFNGTGGLEGALDMQAALYADVKADPALAGVAVDYFTGYNAGDVAVGPDPSTTPGLADYDTQHPYPNYNEAPSYWVSRGAALGNTSSGSTPAVYTETGYSTDNVSDYVQEVYTLDLLMDTAQQGIAQTDLYDLLDAYAPGSPQGDDGYGLFDYTGAAKPAAVGIHNLTSILQQTIAGGADMPSQGVNFSVSNMPSDGNAMEMQNPDSSDVIALWAEPALWDDTTNSEIAAPSEDVTVSLGADYATVSVFDPTMGTAAIETFNNVSSVTVSISDHPVLLEVSGGEVAPVSVDAAPPPQLSEPAPGNALCFAHGTLIRTPTGGVPVEQLTEGDLVTTPFGASAIEWVGRRSYDGAAIADNHLMLPVCIRPGALGAGMPGRELWVSPGHGIWLNGALVPAWRLVNGVSVIQAEQVERVDYVHLELATHSLLMAENCLAESYLEIGQRHIFENAAGVPRRISPALPRLEYGFALQEVQDRLRVLAGMPGQAQGRGTLRGYVDAAGPEGLHGWAQSEDAPESPVSLDVLLDGVFFTRLLANVYRPDLREAGLGSGVHGFYLDVPCPGKVEVRRSGDGAALPFVERELAAA